MRFPLIQYDAVACPRFGSILTARLRRGSDGIRSFRFGSPVVYAYDPGNYNCACLSCGIRWRGDVKIAIVDRGMVRSLKKEWQDLPCPTDMNEEREILTSLAEGLGMETGKKRHFDSPAGRFVKRVARETVSSPIQSLKSFSNDLAGSFSVQGRKDQDDD